jgi:hypothetical protein
MASDRAAYRLADQYDQEVLAYISGYAQAGLHQVGSALNTEVNGTKAIPTAGSNELLASMQLKKGDFGNITTVGAADHSIPIGARLPGATAIPATYVSPVMLINRMKKLLDKQLVPSEGRWLVIDPDFEEVLMDEDSRFHNADWGPNGSLRSGNTPLMISGFKIYKSNNLPAKGTGAGTVGTGNQNDNYGVLVAGTNAAVATAEQIRKTEQLRSQSTFGDVIRGMHLYGRKILRPEAITTAKWNLA